MILTLLFFCSNSLLNCCWFVAVTSCWLFDVAALAIDGVVAAPSEIAKRVITLALLIFYFIGDTSMFLLNFLYSDYI